MKYALLLTFLMLVSCITGNKTYICGDRPCLDRKEFKEYFAENLILEVKIKNSKKYSTVDLVKLNAIRQDVNLNSERKTNQDIEISKKEKKAMLKSERNKLKEKRKIDAVQLKRIAIEKKKLAKLKKIKETKTNDIASSTPIEKEQIVELATNPSNKTVNKKLDILSEEKNFKSIKSENKKNICEKIEDCDIDKITELVIKKSKEKDFPDITLK